MKKENYDDEENNNLKSMGKSYSFYPQKNVNLKAVRSEETLNIEQIRKIRNKINDGGGYVKNNNVNINKSHYVNKGNMMQKSAKQLLPSGSGLNIDKMNKLQPNFKNKLSSFNQSAGIKHTETSLRRHYEANELKNKGKNVKIEKWIGKKNETDISDDDWFPMHQ